MEEGTDLDYVFEIIGEFGPCQKKYVAWISLVQLLAAMHMLISAFLLIAPTHRCALPDWTNDTYEIQSEHHRLSIEYLIPPSADNDLLYDQCYLYEGNDSVPCTQWVYDKLGFKSTFVSQENLVCGDRLMTSHARLIYFSGVLVGSFIQGTLSDMIGRKKTMYLCFWILFAASLALAWAPNFWVFCALRFIIGGSSIGLVQTSFVLGMEIVGPKKRVLAGMLIQYLFSFGLLILAGVFYAFKDWKWIQIATSIPIALYFSYWWLIPESPRWLVSKGRNEEAKEILLHIARGNNKQVEAKKLENLQTVQTSNEKIWHLMNDKWLFMVSAVIFFKWMVVSMGYYGLSLNTGNLSGDFYLNFFLLGLLDIPAFTVLIILLDQVGRKKLCMITLIGGGLSCICTIFTSLYGGEDIQPLTNAFALIGRTGISCTFGLIYLWSSEIFPTVVRNSGLGTASVFARVGSMVSPYIVDISKVVAGDLGRALPLVIFGGVSVIAGLSVYVLPETLHRKLPDTIEDSKALKDKQNETIETTKF